MAGWFSGLVGAHGHSATGLWVVAPDKVGTGMIFANCGTKYLVGEPGGYIGDVAGFKSPLDIQVIKMLLN